MYNMMFGSRDELGAVLAKAIGYESTSDVGRFRDCWVEEIDGEPVIAFHCRNGGGNRECWNRDEKYAKPEEFAVHDSVECSCPGCIQEHRLPANPLYIKDEDDDFDCTYCTTWFRVPENVKAEMAAIAIERPDITGNWFALFDTLSKATPPAKPAE